MAKLGRSTFQIKVSPVMHVMMRFRFLHNALTLCSKRAIYFALCDGYLERANKVAIYGMPAMRTFAPWRRILNVRIPNLKSVS